MHLIETFHSTQTDQYTPSDNAHTHMDSARPLALLGHRAGSDTVLLPDASQAPLRLTIQEQFC